MAGKVDFERIIPGQIDSSDWNKNFSSPNAVGFVVGTNSLEAVNGHLDASNVTSTEEDPFITNLMYRPQSLCNGQMVGQTANMDYPDLVFPGDSTEHNSRQPVPGNCIDFFVPFDAKVVVIQWRWSITNTHPNKDYAAAGWVDGQEITSRCYFDDTLIGGLSRGVIGGSSGSGHLPHTDRCYSMHHLKTSLTKKGWHSAELRIFSNKNTMRLRVRNVKVLWFK